MSTIADTASSVHVGVRHRLRAARIVLRSSRLSQAAVHLAKLHVSGCSIAIRRRCQDVPRAFQSMVPARAGRVVLAGSFQPVLHLYARPPKHKLLPILNCEVSLGIWTYHPAVRRAIGGKCELRARLANMSVVILRGQFISVVFEVDHRWWGCFWNHWKWKEGRRVFNRANNQELPFDHLDRLVCAPPQSWMRGCQIFCCP